MADIVVAFPKIDDAKNLRKLLIRNGWEVNAVCDSGAQVKEIVGRLDGGIVICGYRFTDMYATEIAGDLPESFQLLLLASPDKLAECDLDLVSVAMPFKVQELLSTLDMMLVRYNHWKRRNKHKPKVRTQEEQKTITRAKEILMERNQMTESQAHHYIQKMSMDSCTDMTQTAQMILELSGKEWNN